MAKSKHQAKLSGAKKNKKEKHGKVQHREQVVVEVKEKEKPEPPTPVFTSLKNKFASLLLILLGLLAVLFIGAFFVKKILEPLDIADVLPADETVMMASFDGFELVRRKGEVDLLMAGKRLPIDDFVNILEEALNADYEKEIAPWIGYKHGYALLNLKDENGVESYEHALFVQSVDKSATLDFLEGFQLGSLKDSISEEKYKNYSIYSFAVGQNVNFLLMDKYFVFAASAKVLKKIVDVSTGEVPALSGNIDYLTIRNNLKKGTVFVYYVPAELFDYYMNEPISSIAFIRPALSLFTGVGHSGILGDNAIIVQTYMNFNTALGTERLPRLDTHYKGDLLELMPADFEYFWGSRNLSKVVAESGAVLNQLHPSSFNIMEGVLNAKKEQYFGYSPDLREDIYKVFENEFALGLYSRPDHIDYLFIAENQNQDHIYKLQAYYMATMQERGFKVLEEDAAVEEGDSKSDQISVFPFDVWTNIYTALHKDIFVMSTDISLVEDTLTRIDENGEAGNKELAINSYLKDFDEVNIASPAFMGALLGEKWDRYLSGFTEIQAAKSIFLSGITLVHVFEF